MSIDYQKQTDENEAAFDAYKAVHGECVEFFYYDFLAGWNAADARQREPAKSELGRIAKGIQEWIDGILSSVEEGAISACDANYLRLELKRVEKKLEELTTEIICER